MAILHAKFGDRVAATEREQSLLKTLQGVKTVSVEPMFPDSPSPALSKLYQVKTKGEKETEAAIERLVDSGEFEYVERAPERLLVD